MARIRSSLATAMTSGRACSTGTRGRFASRTGSAREQVGDRRAWQKNEPDDLGELHAVIVAQSVGGPARASRERGPPASAGVHP
jgi:hypothetical protein